MTSTRTSTRNAILGLALLALAACDKTPRAAESPAARQRQAAQERIGAIEKDLAKLDQMLEQSEQQQRDALTNAREQNRRLATELAELKKSLGTELALEPVREVPDEPGGVLVVKTSGSAAAIEPLAPPAPPGPHFFTRLFVVVVLFAMVFLGFKAFNRWQEVESVEAEPDEQRQTPEGTISLSPEARRQGAGFDSGEHS